MEKVYFVNGFLSAGKTSFIKNLLTEEYFDTGETTLLLLCEDGEEIYEEAFCLKHNITIREITEEQDFTEKRIRELKNDISPDRIIVEFNGMWDPENAIKIWQEGEILFIEIIDAQSFELYLNNMKTYLTRQVKTAYLTIFRSCDGLEAKLASFRRNIRAVNPQTNFVFKNRAGEMNPRLDEDLPYNIYSNLLEINDEAYGVFYVDAMEYVARYAGKIVCFTGCIFKKKKKMLLIGRQAMTCCMEDLALFAFICDLSEEGDFKESDWVRVEGEIKEEYFEKQDVRIPTIDIMWIEKCDAPKEQIITVF